MLNLNIKFNDEAHNELLKVQSELNKSSMASTIKSTVALTSALLKEAQDGKITIIGKDNEKIVFVLKVI